MICAGTIENRSTKDSPAVIAAKLFEYCRTWNWAGYDPYDGLNSKVLRSLGCLHFKYSRLALIQLIKRCPINFRPLLLVPKEQNPKGMALFLSSTVKLSRLGICQEKTLVRILAERLIALSSSCNGQAGWGYNFDWQTRGVLVPRGTPNIICTTFAANALLDAYELLGDNRFLDIAADAAASILDGLYCELNSSQGCFSYYPQEKISVHNANLLGAALLCRVARKTQNSSMMEPALKAARFSVNKQHEDGSWPYGESNYQSWVDNFHTGFNLCALRRIGHDAGTNEFEPHVMHGFDFYRKCFFTNDSAPKYYNDRLYPIDIHSAAQSIITLVTLSDLDRDNLCLANSVFSWTMSNMWNPRGYFYYQKHPWWTIRIPYMRWSQAWMLLALTMLEENDRQARQ